MIGMCAVNSLWMWDVPPCMHHMIGMCAVNICGRGMCPSMHAPYDWDVCC